MRVVLALLLVLTCVFAPVLAAPPGGPDGAGQMQQEGGQRFRVINRVGGQVTAAYIAGGDVLAAEGDGLVRLHVEADGSLTPVFRFSLGYGAVLDLVAGPAALYALTESGIVTLTPDGSAVRGFTPGGGQACAAWGDRLVVAARAAGVRLYRLDADGFPHFDQLIRTAGSVQHVAFTESGRLAVADGRGGLRLYDLSDPARPLLIGVLGEVAPAERVAAEDGRVLVASGSMLYLVDTSNPAALVRVGAYNPLHEARAVAWLDGYALLADALGGLKVYDGSDPAALRYVSGETHAAGAVTHAVWAGNGIVALAEGRTLRLFDAAALPDQKPLGALTLPGAVNALAMPDHDAPTLVAALESGGLSVIAVEDAAAPRLLATLPLSGPARGVITHDEVAYVTLGDGSLLAVDVSQRLFPALRGGLPLSGRPGVLALAGDQAVVAAGPAGLIVTDITHPYQPLLRGWLLPAQEDSAGYAAVVALGPDRVAALDGGDLVLIDLSSPALPVVLDRRESGGAVALAAAGSEGALLVAGANRLARYATGADSLAPLDTYAAPTALTGVRLRVGRAILSNGGVGAALILLDTQNPAAPRELQVYDIGSPALALRDQGDEVFLAAGGAGLLHTLLPPEGSPLLLGHYHPAWATSVLAGDGSRLLAGGSGWYGLQNSPDGLWPVYGAQVGMVAALTVDGTRAYVAPQGGGLLAYDLSGSQPVRSGQAETTGPVIALAVGEGIVWALDVGAGLLAFDPQTLAPLAGAWTGWSAERPTALAASGAALYIGLDSGALLAVDVSGALPHITGRLDELGGPVSDVRLLPEGGLIISAGTGGVWLVEATGPASLRVTSHLTVPGRALAAAARENWLAVAAGACGLRLFDVSDPAAPAEQGYWRGSFASDVVFQDDRIALATASGVLALAYDPAGAPVLPDPPRRPSPPDGTEIAPGEPLILAWEPDADPCEPLVWEVVVNGQVISVTGQPALTLPALAAGESLVWQVTAVDAQGDRRSGPLWRVDAQAQGWLMTPPPVRLAAESSGASPGVRIGLAAGGAVLVMGLTGLGGWWLWRRRRRGVWTPPDEID